MTHARFRAEDVADLLKLCHRRCCICHRFCGVKMEIHHIDQDAHGGGNSRDNAMPLCFDCHAEVNHYNDEHPKGRKFSSDELRGHRDQWLQVCAQHPAVFVAAVGRAQAGPLEGLLDELEFNVSVAGKLEPSELGCLFLDAQFKRATESGAITLLDGDTKRAVLDAYIAMRRSNFYLEVAHANEAEERGRALGEVQHQIFDAWKTIVGGRAALRAYLGLEPCELDDAPRVFKRPCTPSARELLRYLEDVAHVISTYERAHNESPTGHHHLIRDALSPITKWRSRFETNPPPGIRPVHLWGIDRAFNELTEIKEKAGQQPSRVAGSYLDRLTELKGEIGKARDSYRGEVAWQGHVALAR